MAAFEFLRGGEVIGNGQRVIIEYISIYYMTDN